MKAIITYLPRSLLLLLILCDEAPAGAPLCRSLPLPFFFPLSPSFWAARIGTSEWSEGQSYTRSSPSLQPQIRPALGAAASSLRSFFFSLPLFPRRSDSSREIDHGDFLFFFSFHFYGRNNGKGAERFFYLFPLSPFPSLLPGRRDG